MPQEPSEISGVGGRKEIPEAGQVRRVPNEWSKWELKPSLGVGGWDARCRARKDLTGKHQDWTPVPWLPKS